MSPSGNSRLIHLFFTQDGQILFGGAEKWARSVARKWGQINHQRKVRVRGLPGAAWYFSCSGHGGYILVAPEPDVPDVLRRFACSGVGVAPKDWVEAYGKIYNYMTVYRFEEDCDWAVFVLVYPQVARWEIENLGVWPPEVPKDVPADTAVVAFLEYAKQTVRRWKPPEIAAAVGI